MAPQYYTSAESPLSPISVRDGEKRPYQYEVVSEDDRLGKAIAIDKVRIVFITADSIARNVSWLQ